MREEMLNFMAKLLRICEDKNNGEITVIKIN